MEVLQRSLYINREPLLPGDAVWDIENPNLKAPWVGNLASTVTSCADLYTTADGELLLQELLSLLHHAALSGQGVVALG